MKRPLLLSASLVLLALAAPTLARAQAPAPPPSAPSSATAFPTEIGRTTVGSTTYTVLATAPLNSPDKGQRLQFVTRESNAGGSSTSFTIVNTGKSKTLAQLAETLGGGLRRFSNGGAAPGQEFAKVGDIRFGGELRLVAVDAEGLRFEYNPPTPRPVILSRASAAAFAGMLGR